MNSTHLGSICRPWDGWRTGATVVVVEVAPDHWGIYQTEPWPDDGIEWVHFHPFGPIDALPAGFDVIAESMKARRPVFACP